MYEKYIIVIMSAYKIVRGFGEEFSLLEHALMNNIKWIKLNNIKRMCFSAISTTYERINEFFFLFIVLYHIIFRKFLFQY